MHSLAAFDIMSVYCICDIIKSIIKPQFTLNMIQRNLIVSPKVMRRSLDGWRKWCIKFSRCVFPDMLARWNMSEFHPVFHKCPLTQHSFSLYRLSVGCLRTGVHWFDAMDIYVSLTFQNLEGGKGQKHILFFKTMFSGLIFPTLPPGIKIFR